MPVHTIQPTFSGGEWAPSLHGRVDLQKYGTAAKMLKNFFVHEHGGASNRPGLEMIAETKTSAKKSRLIPFIFSTIQAYVLEFGENYIRIYKDGGQVVDGSSLPVEIVTTYAEAHLFGLKTVQSADTLYILHPLYTPKQLTRTSHTVWTLSDVSFINGPYRTSNTTKTTITPSATTGNITLTASVSLFDVAMVGTWFRIKTGAVQITAYTSATSVSATVKTTLADTGATTDWAEGAWSDYRGYPGTAVFYSDRFCTAGNTAEPQSIWLSKTGDYTNFGRSSPLVDADGITVTLASRQVNQIRHLVAMGDLLALTSASEWKIGPTGTNGAVTPSSIKAQAQSYRGCSQSAPVMAGNRILFIQNIGAKFRDLGYAWQSDSYDSDNISVFASHLFAKHSIVEMAYQQGPDSILWCVRDDGVLLGLTYLREHEVFAWHQQVTEGVFESVCAIPGDNRTEIWFVVNRTIGGVTKRFVERFAERLPTTLPADQFFVDCGATYNDVPTTTVTGLNWLEGKTVAVLADGNVLPQKVVTGGSISLGAAYSKVQVGLPYVADLETLNIDFQSNDGTVQGRKKSVSEVILRLADTRGGKIGSQLNDNYLDDMSVQYRVELGNPLDLYTGDYQQAIGSGWDTGGRVCVRQSDPLPITILSIIPSVTMGG